MTGVSDAYGSLSFGGDGSGNTKQWGDHHEFVDSSNGDHTGDWDYTGTGTFNFSHDNSWELLSNGSGSHDVSNTHDGTHIWDYQFLLVKHEYGTEATHDRSEHLDLTYDTTGNSHWDYLADGTSTRSDNYNHTSFGHGNTNSSYTYVHPDPDYNQSRTGHNEFSFTRTDNTPLGVDGVSNTVSGFSNSTLPHEPSFVYAGTTSYPGFAILNADFTVRPDGPGRGHPLRSLGNGNAPLTGNIYVDFNFGDLNAIVKNYDNGNWNGLGTPDLGVYDWDSLQDFVEIEDLSPTDSFLRDGDGINGYLSSGYGNSAQQKDVFFHHQRERVDGFDRFEDLNNTYLHTGRENSAFGNFYASPAGWGPAKSLIKGNFDIAYDINFPPVPNNPPNETSLIAEYTDILEQAFDEGKVLDQTWQSNGEQPGPTANGLPDLQNLAEATATVSALIAFEAQIKQQARPEDIKQSLHAVFDAYGCEFADDLEAIYRAVAAVYNEPSHDLVVEEAADLIAAAGPDTTPSNEHLGDPQDPAGTFTSDLGGTAFFYIPPEAEQLEKIEFLKKVADGNAPTGYVSWQTMDFAAANPDLWREFVQRYGAEGVKLLEMIQAWGWSIDVSGSFHGDTDETHIEYELERSDQKIRIAAEVWEWVIYSWHTRPLSASEQAAALHLALEEIRDEIGKPEKLAEVLSHADWKNASGVFLYTAWERADATIENFLDYIKEELSYEAIAYTSTMGLGIVVQHADKLDELGQALRRVIAGALSKGDELVVGSYRKLKGKLPKGYQPNHLNQYSAFEDAIPNYGDGITVAMKGNINLPGSPHYEFHRVLEEFWDQYRRKGGRYFRETPTYGDYAKALRKALRAAGFSTREINYLSKLARKDRVEPA